MVNSYHNTSFKILFAPFEIRDLLTVLIFFIFKLYDQYHKYMLNRRIIRSVSQLHLQPNNYQTWKNYNDQELPNIRPQARNK